MNVPGKNLPPSPNAPETVQIVLANDLQEGDHLPDYDSTVLSVEIRTERLGVEWVDLMLSDQRRFTLDGYDDIAAIPCAVDLTGPWRR